MSFKLKLVGYFLLVSVLPLGAAGWALHSVEKSSESRRVDVRLEAGLRALVATYKGQLSAADRHARTLATSPDLQHALLRGDRRELRRLAAPPPPPALPGNPPCCAATPASCAGSSPPTTASACRPGP